MVTHGTMGPCGYAWYDWPMWYSWYYGRMYISHLKHSNWHMQFAYVHAAAPFGGFWVMFDVVKKLG